MEKVNANSFASAEVIRGSGHSEKAEAHGKYFAKCLDSEGNVKWEDTIDNLVTTIGKNFALDTFLRGSAYTVVGPFMGLISSVSYTAVAVGDTMASHAGWFECSATTYFPTVAARLSSPFAAAAAGNAALTSPLSFSIITNGGTVKGCFIVLGTGAVATLANTAGTLYSAGTFTGGDKVVGVGDTLQVSYTAGL